MPDLKTGANFSEIDASSLRALNLDYESLVEHAAKIIGALSNCLTEAESRAANAELLAEARQREVTILYECIEETLNDVKETLKGEIKSRLTSRIVEKLEPFFATISMESMRFQQSEQGRKGAIGRLKKNEVQIAKQQAKLWVKECWDAWQKDPARYKGPAKFARDMLDKYGDVLESSQVIERWHRTWKDEQKTLTLPAE